MYSLAQNEKDVYSIINSVIGLVQRNDSNKVYLSNAFLPSFLVPLKSEYSQYNDLSNFLDSVQFRDLLIVSKYFSKNLKIDNNRLNSINVLDSSEVYYYQHQAEAVYIKRKWHKTIRIALKKKRIIQISYPVFWGKKYSLIYLKEYFGASSGCIYLFENVRNVWEVKKRLSVWYE